MTGTSSSLVISLPQARELEVGQSLTFRYRREGWLEQGFVLRLSNRFVAFANVCPHWKIDLDLGDEQFYDPQMDRIYCKNHGATFMPSDGLCDDGPCAGQLLEQFVARVTDTTLEIEIPDAQPE
jgi:nitrite reductase/ring-hydroxylating ferredoxin subunit